MAQGKVKWYNETKGYGFIEDENGKDIFVHRSGLKSAFAGLQPDEKVEFDTEQGQKGMMAVNVETIN